jgi:hypothetical protein
MQEVIKDKNGIIVKVGDRIEYCLYDGIEGVQATVCLFKDTDGYKKGYRLHFDPNELYPFMMKHLSFTIIKDPKLFSEVGRDLLRQKRKEHD